MYIFITPRRNLNCLYSDCSCSSLASSKKRPEKFAGCPAGISQPSDHPPQNNAAT